MSPVNHSKQITFEDEECILDIFDTAGQEDFSVPQLSLARSGMCLALTLLPRDRRPCETSTCGLELGF